MELVKKILFHLVLVLLISCDGDSYYPREDYENRYYNSTGPVNLFYIKGDALYSTNNNNVLDVYDISDFKTSKKVNSINTGLDRIENLVDITDNISYLVSFGSRPIDITDPLNPILKEKTSYQKSFQQCVNYYRFNDSIIIANDFCKTSYYYYSYSYLNTKVLEVNFYGVPIEIQSINLLADGLKTFDYNERLFIAKQSRQTNDSIFEYKMVSDTLSQVDKYRFNHSGYDMQVKDDILYMIGSQQIKQYKILSDSFEHISTLPL